jgi:hypothetical protein
MSPHEFSSYPGSLSPTNLYKCRLCPTERLIFTGPLQTHPVPQLRRSKLRVGFTNFLGLTGRSAFC